jgi:hypothetical protein
MRFGIMKSEFEEKSSMLWFGGYPPDVIEGFQQLRMMVWYDSDVPES